MKKTKRQLAAKHLPLTPEQTQAITLAWQQMLDTTLPDGLVWLSASFEKEANNWYLRAFLETQTKDITLDKCAELTRLLDDKLDALPIPAECAYFLEVSSPGLFRRLTTEKEMAFYRGEPVLAVKEGHAPLEGTLGDLDGQTVQLKVAHTEQPVSIAWTPEWTITLNYSIKLDAVDDTRINNLEDAADD